jgi:hypothetical protein
MLARRIKAHHLLDKCVVAVVVVEMPACTEV